MRIEEGFHQEEPPVLHPFLDDPVLPTVVRRFFPESSHVQVTRDLASFGDSINGYIRQLGNDVTAPQVIQYNHFGRRIDQLNTSEGWRALKRVAAKEGIVSTAYDRTTHGALARVLMFMKILLWNADSHMVSCPMAMTDGAARVLEIIGTPHMKQHLLPRLLTRDPNLAYTAGQWMTERPGGSDVSHTETIAQPLSTNDRLESGAPYRLSGVKWFSSATDGQVALALAQVQVPPSSADPSTRALGLGLFVIPLPDADVALFTSAVHALPFRPRNGIAVHRLKNKIGTHALPTAELTLEGTIGFLLIVPPGMGRGEPNRIPELPTPNPAMTYPRPNGVRAISPVLNITRIHSAAASIGHLARCLDIARAYAQVRRVGGATKLQGQVLLVDVPLHTATLARIEILRRALVHFFFGVVRMMGISESGTASAEEQNRLRLLTPVLKAFAAERATGGMEECMAALGGLGYMEETGIGRLIRDSLVEKIWEGTINVLALDMMRAARENAGAPIRAFCKWSRGIVKGHADDRSQEPCAALVDALAFLESLFPCDPHTTHSPVLARPALLLVAQIASASYLLEHAAWSRLDVDTVIAHRWVEDGGLAESIRDVVLAQNTQRQVWDKEIVYAGKARL